MRPSSIPACRATALLGLFAVALGAFGAHSLHGVLEKTGKLAYWEKAVFYHAVHVSAMLVICCLRPFPRAAWTLLGAGIFFFSGSLYGLAVGGPYFLVFLTPLGGLCFLAGWLLLAIHKWGIEPEIGALSNP